MDRRNFVKKQLDLLDSGKYLSILYESKFVEREMNFKSNISRSFKHLSIASQDDQFRLTLIFFEFWEKICPKEVDWSEWDDIDTEIMEMVVYDML